MSAPPLQPLRTLARAKLNLALSVSAPLPRGHATPGYHHIASWFAPIEFADIVSLIPTPNAQALPPGARLRRAWLPDAPKPTPIDWPPEQDLALRALKLLEAHLGHTLPVTLCIDKRIPVGAGLGGGSSDAAAVLRALVQLFALPVSQAHLSRLGSTLGLDVPFFLDPQAHHLDSPPRPALVTGLGSTIERLDLPASLAASHICIIVPKVACPTAAVYKAFDALPTTDVNKLADKARVRQIATHGDVRELWNDLTPAACVVQPLLAQLLHLLSSKLQLPVHLTGSGSCLFFILESASQAQRSAMSEAIAIEGCASYWTHFAYEPAVKG